ncbi:MAG: GTPase ObgE [Deltaproteobacteria bacterium]|nr:MAG: GTPase ObgE [Deltaproteobacteria bacterium]RUA01715.1 MAG: GTPase ObgE [Deltaproteobacteria bacterium]
MKFVDSAKITVSSGAGGRGCVSFRREKFIPRGGPDGGDGGQGGSIIIATNLRKRTLYHLRHKSHFQAKNGAPGQGSQKTGRNGADLVIEVPPGTMVIDGETGDLIKDLVEEERFVIARGGRGGRGNTRFKTSTNRAPRMAQPGEPGQTLSIRLELKLLADVGLIGLPNAGKSTLISAISSARPKIGDYPFTTLYPNLGVVYPPHGEPYVVADIPGLIKGAHSGAGLGHQFLRHIERTQILVHLVDATMIDVEDPLAGYRTIDHEMAQYSETLARKTQIVILNKMDLPEAIAGAESFKSTPDAPDTLEISAATGEGIPALMNRISQELAWLDES